MGMHTKLRETRHQRPDKNWPAGGNVTKERHTAGHNEPPLPVPSRGRGGGQRMAGDLSQGDSGLRSGSGSHTQVRETEYGSAIKWNVCRTKTPPIKKQQQLRLKDGSYASFYNHLFACL